MNLPTISLLALLVIPAVQAATVQEYRNLFFLLLALLFISLLIFSILVGRREHKRKVTKPAYVDLEEHMKRLSGKGLRDQEIRKRLRDAGWHDHAVELVLHDVHTPTSSLEKLQKFANLQIRKGKEKEEIKEMLLDANWPEEVVDITLL
ncbi:hypothetical protein HYS48_01145 [Candidatus Woesearchaeota archaeon]|nr:hypothetical protein [Candidatus Woesearchaeota archaeon]